MLCTYARTPRPDPIIAGMGDHLTVLNMSSLKLYLSADTVYIRGQQILQHLLEYTVLNISYHESRARLQCAHLHRTCKAYCIPLRVELSTSTRRNEQMQIDVFGVEYLNMKCALLFHHQLNGPKEVFVLSINAFWSIWSGAKL